MIIIILFYYYPVCFNLLLTRQETNWICITLYIEKSLERTLLKMKQKNGFSNSRIALEMYYFIELLIRSTRNGLI